MKHPTRISAVALAFVVAVGVLGVSVKTQDRGRGPMRIAATGYREARDADRNLVRMERAGELKLRRAQPDTMIPGRQHERLEQRHKGVPVWGADVVRETDGGTTVSVFGSLYAGIDVDVTPALTPEDAARIFAAETRHAASLSVKPALTVLPRDDGTFALVYRVTGFTGSTLPVLFVNAKTGAVEDRYDDLKRQTAAIGQGRGVLGDQKKMSAAALSGTYVASDEMRPPALLTFDLKGNFTRANYILDGVFAASWNDVAADSDNDWTDGAAVDAHTYLGWVYDYFYKRFGRHGLDDRDAPIRALVHTVRREDSSFVSDEIYGLFLVNAFWCGTCGSDGRGYIVFGDGNRPGYYDAGSGKHFDFQSGALDTAGHELTHAVTDYTSSLIYRNESGALNEAFSDIIATGAEFFYQPVGSGSMKADYLIGEDTDIAAASWAQTGDRSLADPVSFGDPDHYSLRYRGSSDNGGVHTNALIGGHAFYLAVEGGRNRTSGHTVQGVGAANREQIERIFYRAFVYYLTSSATYATARGATIRAAQELYGSGSPAERAITQAWTAVGVN